MSAPPPARFKPRNLLGVLAFLARYPAPIALCVGLLLLNIAIEMSLPQILGDAITHLRWKIEWGAVFEPWVYVQIFFSLVLVRTGVSILVGPHRNRLVQRALADLRAAIYDAIQRLAFHYHDRANTGELISRATTDVWRLQDFFFACLFLSVDIAVSLVATVWLIFSVSTLLGWVTLATMLPTIGLIGYFAGKLQPQWRHVHDLHSAMTTVIQENIAGVRVVKAFAQEAGEIAKFRGKREVFLGTLLKTVNYWAARVPFAQFIFGLSLPLVLWLGGRQVIRGELLIGDLAKAVFYLMAIGNRVGAVGQFTNIVQNASASAERILEVIREPKTIVSGRRALPAGRGAVEFANVCFHYAPAAGGGESTSSRASDAPIRPRPRPRPSSSESDLEVSRTKDEHEEPQRPPDEGASKDFTGKVTLTDISFAVQPGQTVAIVGPTGSGKTTLVNLIPRFYDASGGQVLLDGVDLRELDLLQLRRSVGVIFQETFLFSTTVAENIAFGKPEANQDQIEAAARAAQAHEFIMELERGYDTIIGERGVTLSGGQKQRIAIARAFLMDPRLLILDDATASVDARTERLIQEAMRRLCEGRTTFVIAHRFSTVQHADLILVLREGRIVERGTHAELLKRGGFYREIVEGQMKT
ncbi:MAG: ABC transporter ATP-binding protein [Verrucomicrobia bacterium]|nr:ABC transporter ATP-binding protein [Verrucomicrobiota bacterium]